MDIIYKFYKVNQYLFDTLISNHIYFSSIDQFNDPYDSHLALMGTVSEENFDLLLTSLKFTDETKKLYLDAYKRNPDKMLDRFVEFYKGWLSYIGICCFSKRKDNILLWSHYADAHKGVCLGFDYALMKKRFPQFDEVEYSDDPFYFDASNPEISVSKAALRKASDWKYEEEVRFFVERKKNTDFLPEALIEVNFGARCTPRNMINIQYLLSRLDYKNCKFYKSAINQRNYKVEFGKSDFTELRRQVIKDSEDQRFSKQINFEDLL